MITNADEMAATQRRLRELQERYGAVLADPSKTARLKAIELAGIRGMMEDIEADALVYIRSQFLQLIESLRGTVEGAEVGKFPRTLDQTISVLDTVTEGLRLARSSQAE